MLNSKRSQQGQPEDDDMTATTVVNLKGHRDDPAFADVVYVGRAMYRGGWRLPGSPLANPFRPGPDGSREEVVAMYRAYLLGRPDLLALLPGLRGRLLGRCSPPSPATPRSSPNSRTLGPGPENPLARAKTASTYDTVIGSLPYGYDTLLDRQFKKGAELSGGQWQRIAAARGFYRSAPLLIMDEPTAALDARS